jgi:hypothetical protein
MGLFNFHSRASTTSNASHDDAPPPYNSAESKSTPSSADSKPALEEKEQAAAANPVPYIKRSPKDQLRRYLIEILVFTLSVNIEELDDALGTTDAQKAEKVQEPGQARKTSTLSDQEKSDLYELATVIQRLHRKAATNCWNTTYQTDRDLVKRAVTDVSGGFGHCDALRVDCAFALDIISTYADHRCNPTLWTKTHLGRWTTNWMQRGQPDFERSIAAHAKLIGDVSPNEPSRFVLGGAQEEFQLKWGKFVEATDSYYLALRAGYCNLNRVLRG